MLPSQKTDKYMDPIKRYFTEKHWKKPFALIYYAIFASIHFVHVQFICRSSVALSLPLLVFLYIYFIQTKNRDEKKTTNSELNM